MLKYQSLSSDKQHCQQMLSQKNVPGLVLISVLTFWLFVFLHYLTLFALNSVSRCLYSEKWCKEKSDSKQKIDIPIQIKLPSTDPTPSVPPYPPPHLFCPST